MDPREFYNKNAGSYNLRHDSPATRLVREKEQFLVRKFSSGKILDFGCGTGFHLRPNQIGIDISEKMLIEARKKSASLVQANESLPIKSNSINTVHAFFTVLNMADPERLSSEIFRILRPGGFLLISAASIFENLGKREKTFRAGGSRLKIRLFSMEEIRSIFRNFSLEHFNSIFSDVRPEWGSFRPFSGREISSLNSEKPDERGRIYFLVFRKTEGSVRN